MSKLDALLLKKATLLAELQEVSKEISVEVSLLQNGKVTVQMPKKELANKPNFKEGLILLDFGHGGIDPNTKRYVTAPSKQWQHKGLELHTKDGWIFEGVFNRQVGNELVKMLDEVGIAYKVLSHEWRDIPLREIIKAANTYSNALCLVSIHANAAPDPTKDSSPNGIEVYVGRNAGENSKKYATNLAKQLQKYVPDMNFRRDTPSVEYRVSPSKLGILEDTRCPAILSENGFFTNPNDAVKMCNPDVIHRMAKAHFETILGIISVQ